MCHRGERISQIKYQSLTAYNAPDKIQLIRISCTPKELWFFMGETIKNMNDVD